MLAWLGKLLLTSLLGAVGDFLRSWQRDRDLERLGYEKALRDAAQRHARDMGEADDIRAAVRRRVAVDDWLRKPGKNALKLSDTHHSVLFPEN